MAVAREQRGVGQELPGLQAVEIPNALTDKPVVNLPRQAYVKHKHHARDLRRNQLHLLVAALQRRLHASVVGNVLDRAFVVRDGALSVPHHVGVFANPDAFAGLVPVDFRLETPHETVPFEEAHKPVAPIRIDIPLARDVLDTLQLLGFAGVAVEPNQRQIGAKLPAIRRAAVGTDRQEGEQGGEVFSGRRRGARHHRIVSQSHRTLGIGWQPLQSVTVRLENPAVQVTRILAVRHGETAWNRETRIQGHTDIALNDHGRWQAAQLAQALRDEPIAACYASDLSRARATAQAVADALGQSVATHTGLRERCFGQFEGQTWAELEAAWPAETLAWRKRLPDFAPPGGESLRQLQARVVAAVGELAARHAGEQVLMVVHGGVLDMLYRAATRLDLQATRSWELPNTAINRLLWSPEGLGLVGWADTTHLQRGTLDEHTT